MTMLTTPDQISFAVMAAQKAALKLEVLGMSRHGRSVYSIVKQQYGLKGTKQQVLDQLTKMVEEAITKAEATRNADPAWKMLVGSPAR